MNIYHVGWIEHGMYGLSGVVVAENENEAISIIDLSGDESDVMVNLIGNAVAGLCASILCKESL